MVSFQRFVSGFREGRFKDELARQFPVQQAWFATGANERGWIQLGGKHQRQRPTLRSYTLFYTELVEICKPFSASQEASLTAAATRPSACVMAGRDLPFAKTVSLIALTAQVYKLMEQVNYWP